MPWINNTGELADHLRVSDGGDIADAVRSQSPRCSWIHVDNDHVKLGRSEGEADHGADFVILYFPFRGEALSRSLMVIDREPSMLRQATQGCPDCGPTDPETGFIRIEPTCFSCGGEGAIG